MHPNNLAVYAVLLYKLRRHWVVCSLHIRECINFFYKLFLATNLLEDIIKSLTGWDKTKPIWRKKKGLENMVLNHLFTTHQLTNLRFYPFKENYLNYFPNFEKLQVLNIAKNWSIEDSCFKSIGIFCKSLR